MEITCNICPNELKEKGAILISPPSKHLNNVLDLGEDVDVVRKFHICKDCYDKIIEKFFKEK